MNIANAWKQVYRTLGRRDISLEHREWLNSWWRRVPLTPEYVAMVLEAYCACRPSTGRGARIVEIVIATSPSLTQDVRDVLRETLWADCVSEETVRRYATDLMLLELLSQDDEDEE